MSRVSSLDSIRVDSTSHGGCNSNSWDRLPESLEEVILAKVPISSLVRLVRLCGVCKRWRDVILYSKACPPVTSRHGRLVYFSKGKLFVFSPSRRIWETVSLQFLPMNPRGLKNMVMTTGGLLCFRTSDDWEIIVCNPFTKCYKRLQVPCTGASTIADQPCMPTPELKSSRKFPLADSLLVGIVVDCDTGHFKVVVGGFFPGSRGTTLVYDSGVDSWSKAADVPDDTLRLGRNHIGNQDRVTNRLACGGNLFFNFEYSRERDMLLVYDVQQQRWSWAPSFADYPTKILQHHGKILVMYHEESLRRDGQLLQLTDGTWSYGDFWPLTEHWPTLNFIPIKHGFQVECLGEGDVMFFISRRVDLSHGPHRRVDLSHGLQKTSVREWFHEVATNSDVTSHWEDYIGDHSEGFQVFTPSTVICNWSSR